MIVVRLAHPFSLAVCYCLHQDSRSLHCVSRDAYMSSCWFYCLIQSQAFWYHTTCCKSNILSVYFVSWCMNFELLISVVMQLLNMCNP